MPTLFLCKTDTRLKLFFVYLRISKCCLCVCSGSGRIHKCIHSEGKMASCRAYMYVYVLHGRKGSAQRIQSVFFTHACMHGEDREGGSGQRLNSAAFIHAHMNRQRAHVEFSYMHTEPLPACRARPSNHRPARLDEFHACAPYVYSIHAHMNARQAYPA